MNHFYKFKKISYTLLAILSWIAASSFTPNRSQHTFTGIIHYTVFYESKSPFVTIQSLEERYGTKVSIYYQQGKYKIVSNGQEASVIIYHSQTNTRYMVNSNDSGIVEYADSAVPEKIAWYAKGRSSMVVMDKKCKGVVMETPIGIYSYYFDPKLYIDPAPYSHHNYANFNYYLALAHSPFLQYVYDGTEYRKTIVAESIEEKALDDSEFALPNGVVAR
jgi:hypothetical protein